MKETDTEEFECCVLCGERTSIPVQLPIEFREYYENGCGQLCVACYKKLNQTETTRIVRPKKETAKN